MNTTKGLELAILSFIIRFEVRVSFSSMSAINAGSNILNLCLIIRPQITVNEKMKIFFPAQVYSGWYIIMKATAIIIAVAKDTLNQ